MARTFAREERGPRSLYIYSYARANGQQVTYCLKAATLIWEPGWCTSSGFMLLYLELSTILLLYYIYTHTYVYVYVYVYIFAIFLFITFGLFTLSSSTSRSFYIYIFFLFSFSVTIFFLLFWTFDAHDPVTKYSYRINNVRGCVYVGAFGKRTHICI